MPGLQLQSLCRQVKCSNTKFDKITLARVRGMRWTLKEVWDRSECIKAKIVAQARGAGRLGLAGDSEKERNRCTKN